MKHSRFAVVIVLLALAVCACYSQPQGFILSLDSLPARYVPTYVGNGNIGVSSSPLGLAPTRSYHAWLFDHPDSDVARICSLPGWNAVAYFDGNDTLIDSSGHNTSIESYDQSLNMYNGVLQTSYTWNDQGRKTRIVAVLFVSRSNADLAVIRLTITPQFSGIVRFAFPLTEWPSPHRLPLAVDSNVQVHVVNGVPDVWYPGHLAVTERGAEASKTSGLCWNVSVPVGSTKPRVATIVAISCRSLPATAVLTADTSHDTRVLLTLPVSAGKKYTIDRFIAVNISRDNPNTLKHVRSVALTAMARGFVPLFNDNARAWKALWKSDIIVQGDRRLQSVVRSSLFYLLCSSRAGTGFGIPPMGLSSDGYYGHLFWDSDTWMLPPLLVLHPDVAKSMVDFRYSALTAAERNAARNGYAGAMYPWESDENGDEACPRFAYQNALYEIHVTGDVALAQWEYYLATGDRQWLSTRGYPVLKATADFWAHRATYDPKQNSYRIEHVVSVDEGLIGVTNDVYTMAIARRNLESAISAATTLGQSPDPLWERVASKLRIPYDEGRKLHPAYENVPDSVLGSVAPLIYYPLGFSAPASVVANDLANALHAEDKHGPGVMMGATLYPIAAAQIGRDDLFNLFYDYSYLPFLRGAFNVLAETPQNQSTNFLTGAGGLLQQVIFGYTGLRITDKGIELRYKPMLPHDVTGVKITNLHARGKIYTLTIAQGKATLTPTGK